MIDLRSDTLTKPTSLMWNKMASAEIGDDGYREDPTVRHLEELAADKLGFEAGLFVASGTMGNLVALLTHTQRGDEVFLEAESHIYYNEVGGVSVLANAQTCPIPGTKGKLTPELIKGYVRKPSINNPNPSLLCLENTSNRGGGSVTKPEEMRELVKCARGFGLKIHIDGARIFNAAVACKVDVKELVQGVDSVQFCLTKGLAAPMGSLLVGSQEFISRAAKWKKMLGGGFRQIGIMAAAGIVALETMIDRLEEDHVRAKKLAHGLSELPYLSVCSDEIETNIVIVEIISELITMKEFLAKLAENGIMAKDIGPTKVRFVTHKEINDDDINLVIERLSSK
ncbi:MAG: threonine aldolase [Peptococcaceae bacterium BICA1-8]|nr:MAG: threonine aldolase [Peptococcaceae bacterium BICA1-8]